MRYLCIRRGATFSVNMADLDAAILEAVAERLTHMGMAVDLISEDKMTDVPLSPYDAVLSMARDLRKLSRFHTTLPCYNSTEGIITCSRKTLVATLLSSAHVPQPRFALGRATATTSEPLPNETCHFPLWVKRGRGCSEEEGDTVYVEDAPSLAAAVEALRERGIEEWLLQEHVEGDLVKFYGVEGTPFFHWLYPDATHSKFGLERLNGLSQGLPFQPLRLKEIADKAALALGVTIYGGDCIVDRQGGLRIIDFNDWPSFYCCRTEAAQAIAERVTKDTGNGDTPHAPKAEG